ncbi:MAG: AAA family ATPase [Anaerolineales bacterium]|uniref:AAA family ATPase n=1 Tax=Candidatus Desulfolinea nitratireducens TaxID=2841698 RepID=A0A8J6NSB9_9CHLR|nr:AAA family ATPase [Candidatus Desulfolinea nitratireducens]
MSASHPKISLFLLGAPRLEVEGEVISLPTQKAEALLAFLANHETRHSRERLATFLWGNTSDKRARSSLRNALYLLRDALGEDVFLLERHYVALKSDFVWVDIKEMDRIVNEVHVDIPKLRDTLTLWRAPFLDGISFADLHAFDEWLSHERERSFLIYREGWMRLSKLLLMQGKRIQALEAARQLVSLDPLSEEAHQHLFRLYLMLGDRSAALQEFAKLKARLFDELNIAPSAESLALQDKALHIATWMPDEQESLYLLAQGALVGRKNELRQFSEHWRAVLPVGPARMTLLGGEPGIGKTSLLSAWQENLDKHLFLSVRAFEPQKNTAYDLWIQLLRTSFEKFGMTKFSLSDRWLSEIASILPEIYVQRPDLPRSRYDDSELARGRLMEAIHQWTIAITAQHPLCIFVDDLQWGDQASLQVFAYLLEKGETLPLFIVGTQRTSEINPVWEITAEALQQKGLSRYIELQRLSFDEVSILLSTLAFQPKDPVAFLQRIYQETAGNPLFVVEMAQAIHHIDLDHTPELPIPSTIQGVIRTRLSRLAKETRQILALASLLVQDFSAEFLQATGDFPDATMTQALEEALKANILVEQVGGNYQFSHIKIADVLAADLPPESKQNFHKQIAQTLEKRSANEVERISYHYEKADELTLAVEYTLRSAKRAVELYMDEDALTWYERALNLLAHQDISLIPKKVRGLIPFEQIDISEHLPLDVLGLIYRQRGLISQRTGNYPQAEDDFQLALEHAQTRQRRDEQGAAHNLLSFLAYLRSEYHLVADHAQHTLDFGTKADVPQLRAAGLRNLGIAAYHTQDFDRALSLYKEALTVYEGVGDKVGIATCYNNTGFALRTLRRYEEAILSFKKAFDHYEAAGQMEGQALILANIGRTYASQGDTEKAFDHLDRAHQLSRDIRTDWITVKVWRTKGRVFAQNRVWEKALEAATEAKALAETLGSDEDLGAVYRLLGKIAAAWEESNLGAPEAYFSQSIAILERVGEQYEIQRSLDSFERYKMSGGE